VKEVINRWQNLDIVRVQNGTEVTDVPAETIFHQYDIDNVIRFREMEFVCLQKYREYFTHFNLQLCHHYVGRRYGMVLIVKPGYLNGENEILPVLRLKPMIIGECREVRNHVGYDDIRKDDFFFSFDHIKSVDSLKGVILERYRESMPSLSPDVILSLGVSITKLKIVSQ
jgi:hypothetical protein